MPRHERIEVLARRVRWLDCYRRAIAIGFAIALAPILIHQLTNLLGADWPAAWTWLMTVVTCVIAWAALEVAFAWVTALWETEFDNLARDSGLPRAELLRPRK